jgi:hypothetical protein
MRKISIALLASLILALVLGAMVSADGPIMATEDVYVDLIDPDGLEYGSNDGLNLWVDFTNNGGSYTFALRDYLKFPLSSLTGPVGLGTRLQLYVTNPPTSAFNISLWSTADNWNEGTVTWNNGPVSGAKLDTQPTPLTAGSWITFSSANLTNYINAQRTSDGIASFIIQFESTTSPAPFGIIGFQDSEGTSNQPRLDPIYPTGYAVGGFSATSQMNYIHLAWNTGYESDLLGFNLYRTTSPDGERRIVNMTIIEAKHPGTLLGAEYTFNDSDIQAGVTYYYWLELKEYSGFSFFEEPAIATAFHFQYLPFVER